MSGSRGGGEGAARDALIARAAQAARDYAAAVRDRPVVPGAEALDALDAFAGPMPDGPGDPAKVLDTLIETGGPATVAQTGGRYFGFVNGGLLPIGLAARILADAWDQNAAMGVMSPVAARAEATCEAWLTELFGLPAGTKAGFVSGTSTATLCGLLAARHRLLANAGWDVNARGLNGAPRLRIVTGAEAHGTVLKAIAMAGFGTDCVEYVPVDANGAIRADALPTLDKRTLFIAQAGNVVSGGFDPLRPIARAVRDAGGWLHVDGAFGLWAAASPAQRHLTDGLALAHSCSADAHKTLNAPYDNGIVLCADGAALTAALHNSGSYIVLGGAARDGMLTTPEMSRRARGIELWAILAALGRSGVAALVGQLCARAAQFADELPRAGFPVLNDPVFNQVVTACDTDAETEATLARLQASGTAWMGGAEWRGRKVIRISVCSHATTPDDVTATVAALAKARDGAQP